MNEAELAAELGQAAKAYTVERLRSDNFMGASDEMLAAFIAGWYYAQSTADHSSPSTDD